MPVGEFSPKWSLEGLSKQDCRPATFLDWTFLEATGGKEALERCIGWVGVSLGPVCVHLLEPVESHIQHASTKAPASMGGQHIAGVEVAVGGAGVIVPQEVDSVSNHKGIFVRNNDISVVGVVQSFSVHRRHVLVRKTGHNGRVYPHLWEGLQDGQH